MTSNIRLSMITLGMDYTYKPDETTFDAANATVEGTWENKVFTSDMAAVAGYLKLLKDAGIPVLWRPFHEAAGKWFWWGKDAASHKAMWIAMFNYFKAQGLDNLIWVWTTETGDEDWYPGDQYVDIIGRDIYSKDAETCASQYAAISATYGNKIVALSECGTVGKHLLLYLYIRYPPDGLPHGRLPVPEVLPPLL